MTTKKHNDMIDEESKLRFMLKASSDKEKSLEKNFIFQSVLFLISIIYIAVGKDNILSAESGFPPILKPIFTNLYVLRIVMPALLTYYFVRLGYTFDSYLFQRRVIHDLLIENWKEDERHKFSEIYSSFTNSSFFEVINLYVLGTKKGFERLPRGRVLTLYSVVLVMFLTFNNVLTIYFLSNGYDFSLLNGIICGAVIFFQVWGYWLFIKFNLRKQPPEESIVKKKSSEFRVILFFSFCIISFLIAGFWFTSSKSVKEKLRNFSQSAQK